jgi:hypothetical protein
LTLNGETGEISGTPTANGRYEFVLEAWEYGRLRTHGSTGIVGRRTYAIDVVDPLIAPPDRDLVAAADGTLVVDLLEGAGGGPYVAAEVIAMTPATAANVRIERVGEQASAGYRLHFAAAQGSAARLPQPNASGLRNAGRNGQDCNSACSARGGDRRGNAASGR